MAETGITAGVIAVGDVGIRLAAKLYTFGGDFTSANTSVIAIAQDVVLTSSILTALANVLANGLSGLQVTSKTALFKMKEVMHIYHEAFEEVNGVILRRMPNVGTEVENLGSRASPLVERLTWPIKVELRRENFDRLKVT